MGKDDNIQPDIEPSIGIFYPDIPLRRFCDKFQKELHRPKDWSIIAKKGEMP